MRKVRLVGDEIVEEIIRRFDSGESVRKLSYEFDVGQTTIRDWVKGKSRTGKKYNLANGSLSDFKKVNRLERENKELHSLIRELAKGIKKRKKLS